MSTAPNTKEKQIQEIIKAGRDPAYFTRKYAKIQHQKKGLIPFQLFPFQEDCMADFVKHRLNVVVKARQLGMSTTVAAYAAWLALFHKHQNIMVIATKRATAQNFIRKVKVIIKNVPKWMLLAAVVRDNQQEIEFSHGSVIKAVPTSADAGRSEACALLIIDECVAGDTMVTVRSKVTGEIRQVRIEELMGDDYNLRGQSAHRTHATTTKAMVDWEVMTPTGWQEFSAVKTTVHDDIVELAFDDGSELVCSLSHRVEVLRGEFITASELTIGQRLSTGQHVTAMTHRACPTTLYDLLDVAGGHAYCTNNVVSHNCAHIENFDDLWTGLYPVISTGGKCIALSTPKGVGGQFHKLYTDAELGANDFNPICLPWNVHPERDEEWFQKECRQLGSQKRVSQELLCDFTTSGETFLTNDDIAWVREAVCPPIDKWGLDHSTWVWEYPKPGHRYLISADVARGDGGDYSAFHVIDMDESSVVAEYKSRIPPDRFGDLLAETGTKYNRALLAPESNSFGYSTLTRLRDIGYTRVYKPDNKAAYIVDYSPIGDEPGRMGFSTQGHSRIRILTKLEETIRNKGILLRSSRLHDELKTFVWQGGKARSMSGRNDDLVISLAIGLWLHDSSEGYATRDVELSKCLLDGMGVSSHRINQVEGSGHDVATAWNPYAKHAAKSIPIHVGGGDGPARDPRFNYGDFAWVLK